MPYRSVRLPSQSTPSGFVADRLSRPGLYEAIYLEPMGDGTSQTLIRVEISELLPPDLRTRLVLAMQAIMTEARPSEAPPLRLVP